MAGVYRYVHHHELLFPSHFNPQSYIRNAEAAFRNNSVTEFLHRWFEDGRVADRSKKEKHHRNGRRTIEYPESLQEIACVKQFDPVQGYSY
jgi:hypothetical protein